MPKIAYPSVALLAFLLAGPVTAGAAPAEAGSGNRRISLNVKGISVQEVLKILAESGGLSLAVGPDVKGTVSLFVQDLPVMQLLELAVDMVGAAYREDDGVVRVMSRPDYEATYGEPYRDVTRSEVFEIHHAPVQELLAALAPLRSPSGQLVPDVRSNSLVVTERPYQLRRMRELIRSLDRPLETRAFRVGRIPPGKMAERLRSYLPSTARVEPDPAGQRILVTSSPAVTSRAEALLGLLDRADSLETRAFGLKHADPDTVLEAVQEIVTEEVGSVWADRANHQLFVTDFRPALEEVAALLDRVDLPTPQVLIEARILQISLDEGIKTGIDWEAIENDLNDLSGKARFPILADGEDGIRIEDGDLQKWDYRIAIEALETFGSTELLSSPRILVASGESARIHVGSQVPYVTIDSREGTTGVIDRFEKVTVVDVGVKLEVEVRIHADGLIGIKVSPEVSSVTGFVENIPVVETSETSSMIYVRDGATVILGGLNKKELRETIRGIPLLSRIPLLGYLFSSRSTKDVRSELAIFLTPRIVTGGDTGHTAP